MKILFLLFLLLVNVGCSSKNIIVKPLKRVALVIGNKHYKQESILPNTINDAKAMADTLEYLKFDVIRAYDVTPTQFNGLLEQFKNNLDSNTIAFFYFAGHANTLIPSSIESYLLMTGKEQETLISIYKVYDYLTKGKAQANIICLDSCRNYRPNSEIAKNSKEVSRGGGLNWNDIKVKKIKLEKHALLKAPDNTVTVYATRVNEEAKDKSFIDPKHSPFTRALIKNLTVEGISFTEVLRRVRKEMNKELHGIQQSSDSGDFIDYIYLNPKKADRPTTISF